MTGKIENLTTESVEKIILDETSNDFSILSLFLDADIVVKIVILTLVLASICFL